MRAENFVCCSCRGRVVRSLHEFCCDCEGAMHGWESEGGFVQPQAANLRVDARGAENDQVQDSRIRNLRHWTEVTSPSY
jgi:hypothetical protein